MKKPALLRAFCLKLKIIQTQPHILWDDGFSAYFVRL